MARIGYVDDHIYTDILRASQKANLLRAIFNAPVWAEAFVKIVGIQMSNLALPPADRELVLLRMAQKHGAEYVRGMHEDLARNAGLTETQIEALQIAKFPVDVFSDRQRSILALVDAVGLTRVPEEVVLAVKRHLNDRQIIELFGVIGAAFTVACITVSLDVELDRLPPEELASFVAAVQQEPQE